MSFSERKHLLVDQILRLRRAERLAPQIEEISSVREDLEHQLGRTLSRGMTAQLVGVSQTALDRWVAHGDVPTVITPDGRKAVPITAVLDLVEAVRSPDADHRHPIASIVRARDGRSSDVEPAVRRALEPLLGEPVAGHRLAELRSLAMHAVVAERLDSRVVGEARRRLRRLERDGRIDPCYVQRWEQVLGSPLPRIKRTLVTDTQDARDLRQNTPFAGVLSEPERRGILRLVT